MTSVDSNFNFLCGRPHGAGPPPPVHMRPPEPSPLRVDVINGWPLARDCVESLHLLPPTQTLRLGDRVSTSFTLLKRTCEQHYAECSQLTEKKCSTKWK